MRRMVVYGSSTVSALLGAVYAFDFGRQISGWMLGALLGLNGFMFFGLVVGMLLDRLWPQSTSAAASGQTDQQAG